MSMKMSDSALSLAVAATTCAALLILVVGARADEVHLTIGSGYAVSSGEYGTRTTTTIQSVPLTASASFGDWTADLTAPFVTVDGDANVIPGLGRVVNQNPRKRSRANTTTGSASGLGDVVASLTYDLVTSPDFTFGIDVTGKIKLATGDVDAGLGTGANDETLALGAFKIVGPVTFTADLSYTALGSSRYIHLKKSLTSWSVGALYRATPNLSLGLTWDQASDATKGVANSEIRELTVLASYRLSERWRLHGYVLTGFSDGSPDHGFGASMKFAF